MRKLLDSLTPKEYRELRKQRYVEGPIVDLKFDYEQSEEEASDGIPTVFYIIVSHETKEKLGRIDLRLKMNEEMYYYGHVGYGIYPKHRGHNYAYEACKLVFKVAKEHYHMDELFITCNPDNVASYKILKKLNGELVEVKAVPITHELYRIGDRMKCIFRYQFKL